MSKFIRPSTDRVFKHVFADPQDLEPLRSLLREVLNLPEHDLAELVLLDRELSPFQPGDKIGVVDVLARTAAGDEIDIEIQLEHDSGFEARLAFYAARLLSRQGRAGSDYDQMRRAICVAITDFLLTGTPDNSNDIDYHHRFHLLDDTHGFRLTDVIQVDLLEIPKLPAEPDGHLLWHWLRFIGAHSKKEMEMQTPADPVIAGAVRKVNAFTDDDVAAYLEDRRIIQDMIWHSLTHDATRDAEAKGLSRGRAEGKAEGIAEGKAEGLAEGKAEIIRALLAKGLTVDRIAELTDLAVSDIQAMADDPGPAI